MGLRLTPEECVCCRGKEHNFVVGFSRPPVGETPFPVPDYYRELWQCRQCRHVVNRHQMDLRALYEGDYREVTYGDRLGETFDRIMALPPQQSDNRQRVIRIQSWADLHLRSRGTVLDVGSGLAVFPAAMREAGWTAVALDPDKQAVAHAERRAGVEAVQGDFFRIELGRRFELITLNKVLEHVVEMEQMLKRAAAHLTPGGFLYVEVPDGEAALLDGPQREEFFIEHYCAFSPASLAMLATKAGLFVDTVERVREPSGKYTLRSFLRPRDSDAV